MLEKPEWNHRIETFQQTRIFPSVFNFECVLLLWNEAHWPNSVLSANFSIHLHHTEGIGSKAESFLFL